jgi:hypothetical protein
MSKLQAGFSDCRIIDDRQEACRVGHDGSIEQRLIVIEEVDEVDVTVEIAALVAKLHHNAAELQILRLDNVWY